MIDVSMPKLDGWTTVKELRSDHRTNHVPCIAVTALDRAGDEYALKAGFDAFVAKPFDSEELLATVRRLLSIKRPTTLKADLRQT